MASRGAMCAAMSIAAFSSSQRNCKDAGNLAREMAPLSVETSFTFNLSKLASSPSDTSPTSPGSMISDHSSQFSRSSSISSGSSGSPPSSQVNLLQRATLNARNQKAVSDRYDQVTVVSSSTWDDCSTTAGSITASPEVYLDLYEETVASRKRPMRPSFDNSVSIDNTDRSVYNRSDLQQEVRGMLRTLAEDSEKMHSLRQFALPRLTSKRACVDATALDLQYTDSTSYIRPRSGPGMWHGIL